MSFWDRKKVLVTGGAGFVGSHLVEDLFRRSASVSITVADHLRHGRLRNLVNAKKAKVKRVDIFDDAACRKVCQGQNVILHLAARVGGIGYNMEHPATMFRDNMILSHNILEAARLAKAERVLIVSSACVYPRFCTVPTPETEGFKDSPEETNDGYGWAKRMAEFEATAYHRQFGMRVAIARPYNCYGPRDYFDPEASHVIPALIRRVFDGENPLKVWGNGKQTRAFLYVEDLARGLLDVAERYAECDPVNLGTTEEVSIAELIRLILKVAGSSVEVEFDTTKPAGQPRRNCDNTKAREKIGFKPRVSLEDGLRSTIEWYRAERKCNPPHSTGRDKRVRYRQHRKEK